MPPTDRVAGTALNVSARRDGISVDANAEGEGRVHLVNPHVTSWYVYI